MSVIPINVNHEAVAVLENYLKLAKQGQLTSFAVVARIGDEIDTEECYGDDGCLEMLAMSYLLSKQIAEGIL